MIAPVFRRTWLAILVFTGVGFARSADELAVGFAAPPAQTKPWCYWYWISDHISREGITQDIEAMARVGIGEALIGNIFLDKQPAGPVKVLSEEWWALVGHAIREGGRLGVNIGFFNCPGWSQSGGPWIKPAESMRYLISSETRVTGPVKFSAPLAAPAAPFEDVAVLAYPVPQDDVPPPAPAVQSAAVADAARLVDGDYTTIVQWPSKNKTPVTIEMAYAEPVTVRSLQLFPGPDGIGAEAELWALAPGGEPRLVRRFTCDRTNMNVNVGPMPRGPVTVSFPPVTAKTFHVVLSNVSSRGASAGLAEIRLSGAARVEAFVEKQLGKMHATPLPKWDTYLWPAAAEPESPALTVAPAAVHDLSKQLAPDGTLTWDVPPGDWIIQRTGMTPTGTRNHPASPEAEGLEVDKMNRALAQQHFNAFVGELLRRVPAAERKAFTRVVADSYEMGSQNWTNGLEAGFTRTYGYDPRPWLPVLTGRVVGSADQSDRFLWDLRRLVADRVATDYVGGLRDAAHAAGLGLWLENYGHWGFPGEFLKYGGEADRIGGEFWVTGDLGSIECRAASSAANTYGKPFVSAESFTGGPPFKNAPRDLKARGDWSFCEGINHVVLHVYIHQPDDAHYPGINAPWGTEFNRHNTWFESGKAWVDYERRCSWLLQQGWRVADVAYFIGEDTPKMTGGRDPALPAGYDFDYINAEVIERDLTVRDGRLVLPHGVSYAVLVLPPQKTMRPALLRKLRELVRAGATIIGPAPERSPSLAGFPESDGEVKALAAELWGGPGGIAVKPELGAVLAGRGLPPDVEFLNASPGDARLLFTHRSAPGAEIYFVSNQADATVRVNPVFRVKGRQPELWDAVTGERRLLPDWRELDGRTQVPLVLAPRQSWFVVFRETARAPLTRTGENFPASTTLLTLAGEWEASFDPRWGGPAQVNFPELVDWTTQTEKGIKFYSGKATYRKNFEVSADVMRSVGTGGVLDLGAVNDLATVRLNGKTLGTVWIAPWRVQVAGALHEGTNVLEIEVVNVWNNRLVGDLALNPGERLTSLSQATIKKGTALLPAGLLGPVTLQAFSTANP